MKKVFDRASQKGGIGYILLWALGIPLPVLVLIYLFWH